jgi:hypothetical protein
MLSVEILAEKIYFTHMNIRHFISIKGNINIIKGVVYLANLPITNEVASLFLQELYYRHRDNGNGLELQEAYKLFANTTGLTNIELNQRMKDNRLHWNNRVQQAVRILKNHNYATSDKNGYWTITEDGKQYFETMLHTRNK